MGRLGAAAFGSMGIVSYPPAFSYRQNGGVAARRGSNSGKNPKKAALSGGRFGISMTYHHTARKPLPMISLELTMVMKAWLSFISKKLRRWVASRRVSTVMMTVMLLPV